MKVGAFDAMLAQSTPCASATPPERCPAFSPAATTKILNAILSLQSVHGGMMAMLLKAQSGWSTATKGRSVTSRVAAEPASRTYEA